MVVGLDKIDTGTWGTAAVQRFSKVMVSRSDSGCVIMEMHMRWNCPLSLPARIRSMTSS